MSEEYCKFDAEDYVKSEEDAKGLLRAAVDEDLGDGAVIRAALKHLARTQNMSALARDTGLTAATSTLRCLKMATPPWQHC